MPFPPATGCVVVMVASFLESVFIAIVRYQFVFILSIVNYKLLGGHVDSFTHHTWEW